MRVLGPTLALFSVALLNFSTFAADPYPLLDTTPAVVCNKFLLGARHGKPAPQLGFSLFQWLMGLRYVVSTYGLEEVLARGDGGMLFLSNHTAAVDPLIMVAAIHEATRIRPVMTEDMLRGPISFAIRPLAATLSTIVLPARSANRQEHKVYVQNVIDEISNALIHGDNILLYPSGRLQRGPLEIVGNTSGVHRILQKNPNTRIILVRQRGLWGSSWSHGAPEADPHHELNTRDILVRGLITGIKVLLGNLVVLAPRRPVTLEFFEPEDFPTNGSREEINSYLEKYYNDPAVPERRTFVSRYFWRIGEKTVPVEESVAVYYSPTKGVAQEVKIAGE